MCWSCLMFFSNLCLFLDYHTLLCSTHVSQCQLVHNYRFIIVLCPFIGYCFMQLVTDADLRSLARATARRRHHAFRPGTRSNHTRQFVSYLSFCSYYRLQDVNPLASTLCMYAEFLARSFTSPRSIRNYLSGVRLMHHYLGQDAPNLDCFELDLILRALDITLAHVPTRRLPITESILSELWSACDYLGPTGIVLRFAFLFGFFSFVRQSNWAPTSASSFDPHRHTCRGDIFVHPPGLVVLLKWSKTLQTHEKMPMIPLPAIPGHHLCPVQAYHDMLAVAPTASPNDPLLMLPTTNGGLRVMTTPQLRKAFNTLMECLGYSPAAYSLHSFRRGGATAAHRAGADFLSVQRHGTWTSDAFWDYIVSDAVENSPVAHALAARAAQH